MANGSFRNCSILVLEDNAEDAWLLQRALTQLGLHRINCVGDGEEGIEYLTGREKFSDRTRYPVPEFIITDLKMPLLGGLEFLKWLRDHPNFRKIPTLVLTSSKEENDVANAYGFGANSYMVKPTVFEDLEKLANVIRGYWENCEIPPSRYPQSAGSGRR